MELKDLDEVGWQTFESDQPILELAQNFGIPVPARRGGELVSILRVLPQGGGHSNSLTSRYGKGAFPFHTDGAHFRRVPRYVLMRAFDNSSSGRPTVIVNLRDSLDKTSEVILKTERWMFGTGPSAFISPVLSPYGLRYDPSIMRPAIATLRKSELIVEEIIATQKPVYINWNPRKVLVLDNHKVLHARAGVEANDENRIIERVLVNNI